MKQVLLKTEQVTLDSVSKDTPIFTKKDGKMVGIVTRNVYETWYLDLVTTDEFATKSRNETIQKAAKEGYTFWVEE